MVDTLFQWPGGKGGQFERIKSLMPEHECFVESFGGSGVVTLNKRPSDVDVYNDLDNELVHFFIVYREAPERLVEWLNGIPYSKEQYKDFIDEFYGEPDVERDESRLPGEPITNNLATGDDISHNQVRRAGIFFALRYMQFGAKYSGRAGFGRSKVQNGAETFHNAKERLDNFKGCWDHVTIECLDFEKIVELYDGEETLFYFDPPYIGTETYYLASKDGFDHNRLIDTLEKIDGYWIVSYDEVPQRLSDYHITVEESTNFIDSGVSGEGKDTVESIITNFDPNSIGKFYSSGQSSLSDMQASAEDGQADEDEEVTLFEDADENDKDDTVKLFGDNT
jgi:DNA adenine methylase